MFRTTGRYRIVRHPIGALCCALLPAACIASGLWSSFDTTALPLRSLEEASCLSEATRVRIDVGTADGASEPFKVGMSTNLAIVANKGPLVVSRHDAVLNLIPIDFFDLFETFDRSAVPALSGRITSWQAGENPIANLKKDDAFWLQLDAALPAEWTDYLRLDQDLDWLNKAKTNASGDVVRELRPRGRFNVRLRSSSPFRNEPLSLVCAGARLNVTYSSAVVKAVKEKTPQ
jgi:hypothetical protein